MKTMFKYASLLFVSGAILITSCSKKKDEETTEPIIVPPVTGSTVCLSGKKTQVLIDASTNAGAANYSKSYTCSVTTTQDTDTLVLDIKAKSDMDYIYITKSEDNGTAVPMTSGNLLSTSLKTGNDKTVSAGTDWSYELPSGSISAFILKIPVRVRNSSAAVSDVYTIWMTNGKGNFTATGKKTVVGPIVVSLSYKSNTAFIPGSNITLGDQNNTTYPSYLTTTGVIGVISGADLINSDPALTTTELTSALNSVDINFVGLNTAGTALATDIASSVPYFIGVGLRQSVGFTKNIEGTVKTKFGVYSGTDFSTITGASISSLSYPTTDRIKVESGKTYTILTADGRLGLVKINSLTKEAAVAIAAVSARMEATGSNIVNVDVKVLASAK